VFSTDYTQGLSLQAIKLVFNNLETAYNFPDNVDARSNMHNASTIVGMAFSNAFLGICHSMAHQLGHMFGIPHGIANAMLITYVIEYNSDDHPTKRTAFPQYSYYKSKEQYAHISRACHFATKADSDNIAVQQLVEQITYLKQLVGIPKSIQEYGISEKDFFEKIETVSIMAYDDQCTGANPRHPLVKEIQEILTMAYFGK
jgi:acetaldehyde dehydrogenase/alcohol dehydrogenase